MSSIDAVDRNGTWRNWGRSATSTPAGVRLPASEEEVLAVLAEARDRSLTVKVVGGSHSFTDIAVTDGLLISLDLLQGITGIDLATGRVTMRGGTRLWTLADALEPYGLALPNMGDIDRQSIAGALSTSTHGTGLAFTGFAGITESLRLALADGSVVTVSREQDPELFEAARVGLGAIGIILEATLRCVPAFNLSAAEHPEPLEAMVEQFVERSRHENHLEFYWFQHTDVVSVKTNTRLPVSAERKPLGRTQTLLVDEVVSNGGHRLICEVGRAVPRLVTPMNKLAARFMGDRDFTDRSDRVFVSPRRTRFREMEYAVPLADFQEVFREVMAAVNSFADGITFPLEIRTTAADDTWMGTASGRESAYIAFHRFVKEDHVPYFAAVEPILKAAAGRPHWAKIHTRTAADLPDVYPHFADFLRVRDRVDPDRLFTNAYLQRVLGS